MKRYYKKENGKTLIRNDYKIGWRVVYFDNKQEYMNGGCPDNIVWDETGKPSLMSEEQMVAQVIGQKLVAIEADADAYVSSRGYSRIKRDMMQAYSSTGTASQKALCNQVFEWIKLIQFDSVKDSVALKCGRAMNATTFAELNAVKHDFDAFDALDPQITVSDIELA